MLPNIDVFEFNFSFQLDEYEKKIVNVLNTEFGDNEHTVCLVSKKIIKEMAQASTDFYDLFKRELKIHDKKIGISCKFKSLKNLDIIFISYDEQNAIDHYNMLYLKYGSRVKQVHGIHSIMNSHYAASLLSSTDFFYVIDADAEIIDDFNFDYNKSNPIDYRFVHIWYSYNPLNGLTYGYGGVKLFHKTMFKKSSQNNDNTNIIDMSTSISQGIKIIPEISCITRFNTDEFSTWRSAFRECVKLSSNLINGSIPEENNFRLSIWTSIAFSEERFNNECLLGATQGKEFGTLHKNNPHELNKINDFKWLKMRFRNRFSF